MDAVWGTVDASDNIVRLLRGREIDCSRGARLRRHCQFTADLLRRLRLAHTLDGHQGCVNCLQWSADGLRLASGSDDTVVRIWDPFANKCLHVMPTKHIGNIFSVKFVSDGRMIATCAGDCRVIVQSIEECAKQSIMDCSCHAARVKRLATAPDCPTLFWSAGEDGLVLQYDLREPHECTKNATAFLDLYTATEFKCIAVNPTKPHLIAIGANDAYIRLYDRRFVKTSNVTINHALGARKRTAAEPEDPACVQYFAPGHLVRDTTDFSYHATYVTFDAAGNDLLVNMGGDHVYLFDINSGRTVDELSRPDWSPRGAARASAAVVKPCCANLRYDSLPTLFKRKTPLPFNHSLASDNPCACEYIARARQLMYVRYIGDVYLAARDCLHVIRNWPRNVAGYLGLIECLVALKWADEAQSWMAHFKEKFPAHALEKVVVQLGDCLADLRSKPASPETPPEAADEPEISPVERTLRLESRDYESRFLGHCNTTTDIKEANFMGADGRFICAGSDNGMIFFWDRKTTNLLTALVGDVSIVNCVQPHPSVCYLASSGIDSGVKIWSPMNEDLDISKSESVVKDVWGEVVCNQERMAMDPFDTLMMSMGFREVRTTRSSAGEVTRSTCRTS